MSEFKKAARDIAQICIEEKLNPSVLNLLLKLGFMLSLETEFTQDSRLPHPVLNETIVLCIRDALQGNADKEKAFRELLRCYLEIKAQITAKEQTLQSYEKTKNELSSDSLRFYSITLSCGIASTAALIGSLFLLKTSADLSVMMAIMALNIAPAIALIATTALVGCLAGFVLGLSITSLVSWKSPLHFFSLGTMQDETHNSIAACTDEIKRQRGELEVLKDIAQELFGGDLQKMAEQGSVKRSALARNSLFNLAPIENSNSHDDFIRRLELASQI